MNGEERGERSEKHLLYPTLNRELPPGLVVADLS